MGFFNQLFSYFFYANKTQNTEMMPPTQQQKKSIPSNFNELADRGFEIIQKLLNHPDYIDLIEQDFEIKNFSEINSILERITTEKNITAELNRPAIRDFVKKDLSTPFIRFLMTNESIDIYEHFHNVSSESLAILPDLIFSTYEMLDGSLQALQQPGWSIFHIFGKKRKTNESAIDKINKRIDQLDAWQNQIIDAMLLRTNVAAQAHNIFNDDVSNKFNEILNRALEKIELSPTKKTSNQSPENPIKRLFNDTFNKQSQPLNMNSSQAYSKEEHPILDLMDWLKTHFTKVQPDNRIINPKASLLNKPIRFHTEMKSETFNNFVLLIQQYGNDAHKELLYQFLNYPINDDKNEWSELSTIKHHPYRLFIPNEVKNHLQLTSWWIPSFIKKRSYNKKITFLKEQQAILIQYRFLEAALQNQSEKSESSIEEQLEQALQWNTWIPQLCKIYTLIQKNIPKNNPGWEKNWMVVYNKICEKIATKLSTHVSKIQAALNESPCLLNNERIKNKMDDFIIIAQQIINTLDHKGHDSQRKLIMEKIQKIKLEKTKTSIITPDESNFITAFSDILKYKQTIGAELNKIKNGLILNEQENNMCNTCKEVIQDLHKYCTKFNQYHNDLIGYIEIIYQSSKPTLQNLWEQANQYLKNIDTLINTLNNSIKNSWPIFSKAKGLFKKLFFDKINAVTATAPLCQAITQHHQQLSSSYCSFFNQTDELYNKIKTVLGQYPETKLQKEENKKILNGCLRIPQLRIKISPLT